MRAVEPPPASSPAAGRRRVARIARYAGAAVLGLLALGLCLLVGSEPVRSRYIGTRTCAALPAEEHRPERYDTEYQWECILAREQVLHVGQTRAAVRARMGPARWESTPGSGCLDGWGGQAVWYPCSLMVVYGPDDRVQAVYSFWPDP